MWKNIRFYRCVAAALGSVILAFGLYHVHSFAGVTEGGMLGMTLLLDHWLHLSPAVTGFVLNAVCFLFGWRVLGREFVVYSVIATAAFSGSSTIPAVLLTGGNLNAVGHALVARSISLALLEAGYFDGVYAAYDAYFDNQ